MTESKRPRPSLPVPVPVPDGGIPIVLPTMPQQPSGPRRPRRLRRTRRFLRTARGRWTVAGVIVVVALLVGLLASGLFRGSPGPADAPAVAAGTSEAGDLPASATSGTAGTAATGPASAADVKKALQSKAGDITNPLTSLRGPGKHRVAITVTSGRPIQLVGYLVPTSIDTDYAFGTVKPKRTSWTLDTDAVGRGYLAAVFVQADKSGAPVRCVVTVDGRTTDSQTTGGAYGRQVCLG